MGMCGFEAESWDAGWLMAVPAGFLRLGGGSGGFPAGWRQRLPWSLPPQPHNFRLICVD